eukprot:scaffold62537_cov16-Tisochrysis_lutea.AAC.1
MGARWYSRIVVTLDGQTVQTKRQVPPFQPTLVPILRYHAHHICSTQSDEPPGGVLAQVLTRAFANCHTDNEDVVGIVHKLQAQQGLLCHLAEGINFLLQIRHIKANIGCAGLETMGL